MRKYNYPYTITIVSIYSIRWNADPELNLDPEKLCGSWTLLIRLSAKLKLKKIGTAFQIRSILKFSKLEYYYYLVLSTIVMEYYQHHNYENVYGEDPYGAIQPRQHSTREDQFTVYIYCTSVLCS